MRKLNKYLKIETGFHFLMLFSFLLAVLKIVVSLKFIPLSVFFLLLGFVSYYHQPKKALYLFFFLLPVVNALPDLFFNGLPFNYMAVALFYLCGMIFAEGFWKNRSRQDTKEDPDAASTTGGEELFNYKWSYPYLLFLIILWISALFAALRWTGATLPSLSGLTKDLPATPAGELVSFASIFPVVTLFLFSVSPYLLILMKANQVEESKVFRRLLGGYILSFHIALFQKIVAPDFLAIKWWGEKLNQYNGGFSDFNAFGFFSGALFLYTVIALVFRVTDPGFKISKQTVLRREFIFLLLSPLVTLSGIFLSGCRTAFLFVLFVLLFLLVTKRIKLRYKLASMVLIVVLIGVFGGTLKTRVLAMAGNIKKIGASPDIITAIDKVTNGRIEMMQRSVPIIKNFPVTGVGSGNFLFYLKYRYLGEKYWEDLPLNQYLLILDETGFIGLAVFIFFLVALLRQERKKIYSWFFFAFLVAIFFNFFFWFPEILLLFWIIAAFGQERSGRISNLEAAPAGKDKTQQKFLRGCRGQFFQKAPPARRRQVKILLTSALLVIFILFNILYFDGLHPKTWAQEKEREYGYGLWYLEKTPADEAYRWTKSQAGVYLYLDEKGESKQFRLFCGAPLDRLKNKKQAVKIYWRGKLYEKVEFRENKEFLFKIKDKPGVEGFLELRITPTFNLKEMGLSPEARDLGVQFFTLF